MDSNRMYSPREDQERWFVRQLEIADELKLPIAFHERDSGGRFIGLLRVHPNPNRRGVVHCFSGTRADQVWSNTCRLHGVEGECGDL